MQFILEYWAQWAFALMGGAVLAAIPKIKALWQAVLALLHDRIYTECYHFLSLGHITPDGLRNLTYLYKTYHTMGGNGTGTELYNRANFSPPTRGFYIDNPAQKADNRLILNAERGKVYAVF